MTGTPSGSAYLEAAQLDTFISRQWAMAPGSTVVKSHQVGPVALQAIRTGTAKAVCTFRDPRDCVASDLVFFGQGFQASVQRVAGTFEYLTHFQASDHMLLVRYERMMSDPKLEIRRVADHLEVTLDHAAVDRIHAGTNLEATKNLCKQLKFKPANRVLNIASHRVDPVTQLHENHINGAETGRWRREFNAGQVRWLNECFSSWLVMLGYETQESLRGEAGTSRAGQLEMPAIGSNSFPTSHVV